MDEDELWQAMKDLRNGADPELPGSPPDWFRTHIPPASPILA